MFLLSCNLFVGSGYPGSVHVLSASAVASKT
uniref:Uncharacterized protein n=1 Tax=Podoviridae sp. ctZkC8 TaxID=2825259 RepID=A0A8S5UBM5_9CAUD|nr:MAG TPA: hypothetical protein [Podoviridae sp. ctZkC8]